MITDKIVLTWIIQNWLYLTILTFFISLFLGLLKLELSKFKN